MRLHAPLDALPPMLRKIEPGPEFYMEVYLVTFDAMERKSRDVMNYSMIATAEDVQFLRDTLADTLAAGPIARIYAAMTLAVHYKLTADTEECVKMLNLASKLKLTAEDRKKEILVMNSTGPNGNGPKFMAAGDAHHLILPKIEEEIKRIENKSKVPKVEGYTIGELFFRVSSLLTIELICFLLLSHCSKR